MVLFVPLTSQDINRALKHGKDTRWKPEESYRNFLSFCFRLLQISWVKRPETSLSP